MAGAVVGDLYVHVYIHNTYLLNYTYGLIYKPDDCVQVGKNPLQLPSLRQVLEAGPTRS